MTRIDELLEEYSYHQKMMNNAIANNKPNTAVYASNHLSVVLRQLHNAGISSAQIERLVNA